MRFGPVPLEGALGVQDIPVMGAPGCVGGKGPDGVDLVLPRPLAGERLEPRDLVALGHGGLRVR